MLLVQLAWAAPPEAEPWIATDVVAVGLISHSVVSPDGGATIWDAAIDLDGDEDPSSEPVSPLAAKGIPQEEYFWRLTYDPITIVNDGLCYVR